MPKLPRLTARQNLRGSRKGWVLTVPSKRSHKIYKNAAGKRATVPFHGSKILHPKLLNSIMRDADLAPEDLDKLL